MRLTNEQITIIKDSVAEVFGPDAETRVFGSRLDDKAKGGDIDLLVYLSQPCPDRVMLEARLAARLEMRLGEQPLDIIVIDPEVRRNSVHYHALATSQVL